MRKRYSSVLAFFFILITSGAFAQAKESTVEFHNAMRPTFSAEYDFPTDVVIGAIEARLKLDKISANSRKGLLISSMGVHYRVLTPDAIDLYIQVQGRGKRNKGGSTVYMFVSKGKDNFISGTGNPDIAQRAITYLDDLKQDILVYSLQLQLKQLHKSADKTADNYKDLLKDIRKTEGKRYEMQRELSDERDLAKSEKLRKKIAKQDKSIRKKQKDSDRYQRDMEEQKNQISQLQERLDEESPKIK